MKTLRFYTIIISSLFVVLSCGQAKEKIIEEKSNQQKFYDNFKTLEGKRFSGTEIFISDTNNSWAHLNLEMFVQEFSDTLIKVPFKVGDNKSRTWMFFMEDENILRFRHDHRHEDGTPEDLTMYGGYATDEGSEFIQFFPADQYTCDMLPRICDNLWIAEFSEDLSTFSYSLKKGDNLIITIRFDLTQPL